MKLVFSDNWSWKKWFGLFLVWLCGLLVAVVSFLDLSLFVVVFLSFVLFAMYSLLVDDRPSVLLHAPMLFYR